MIPRTASHRQAAVARCCSGLALAALLFNSALAQTADPASAADLGFSLPSAEQVKQRIEGIEQATDIPEAERAKLASDLKTVLDDLAETARMDGAAAEFASAPCARAATTTRSFTAGSSVAAKTKVMPTASS